MSEINRNQQPADAPLQPRTTLHRCISGRCPHCGVGNIMQSWFRVNSQCPACSRPMTGDEAAFLGAMTLNYGLTVFLVFPLVFLIWMILGGSTTRLFGSLAILAVLLPLILYPFSWRLWIWIHVQWLSDRDDPEVDP